MKLSKYHMVPHRLSTTLIHLRRNHHHSQHNHQHCQQCCMFCKKDHISNRIFQCHYYNYNLQQECNRDIHLHYFSIYRKVGYKEHIDLNHLRKIYLDKLNKQMHHSASYKLNMKYGTSKYKFLLVNHNYSLLMEYSYSIQYLNFNRLHMVQYRLYTLWQH